MGWYYPWVCTSRKECIRYVLEQELTHVFSTEEPFNHIVKRHCLRGNVIYALCERTDKGLDTMRYIAVYLLQRGCEGLWGYKPMDESMCPYYYECPISYLNECTEPLGEGSIEWRQIVRSRHMEKESKMKGALL